MKQWWQKIKTKLAGWSVKKKIVAAVVMLAVIGVPVYLVIKKNKTATSQIETVMVERKDIVNSITLSGSVVQSNLISVSTKASGVVSKVYVTDEQVVKQGEKLAEITLDSEGINNQASAWSSYLSAQNNVESAQRSLWTLESSMWKAHETFEGQALDTELSVDDPIYIETNREWLAAEDQYLDQQKAVQQSKAALTASWNNYKLYQSAITAPTDGTIVGLNLAEGLTVSFSEGNSGAAASQTVAKIKTAGAPIAEFQVTEVDINKVAAGQKAVITLDSLDETEYQGTVVAIDRVGTSTSGVTQYPVLIQFDEANDQILANMAATAEIVLEKKEQALVVPLEAVKERQGKSMVTVMKNGQPEMVEVETGIETDLSVEVVSGLEEGDEVIVTNGSSSSTSSTSGTGGMGGMMMMGGGPR